MSGSGYRTFAVAVLAVLAGALVLAAVVLLARDSGNAPIIITPPAGEATDNTLPRLPTAEAELKVHVTGAVRNPGVHTLFPGDLVRDALAAAGGTTDEADLEAINLARKVQDEAYYHVPRIGETARPPVRTASAPARPTEPAGNESQLGSGLIDLNTASVELLETLPGIGRGKAQAIVDYRERSGPFQSVEEITKVQGVGTATYEKIKELATAGETP